MSFSSAVIMIHDNIKIITNFHCEISTTIDNLRHYTVVSKRSDKACEYPIMDWQCDASVSDLVIDDNLASVFRHQTCYSVLVCTMPRSCVLISGLLLVVAFLDLTSNVCYKDCRVTKCQKKELNQKLLSNRDAWKAGANRPVYDGKQFFTQVRKFNFYSHLWLEQERHWRTLLERAKGGKMCSQILLVSGRTDIIFNIYSFLPGLFYSNHRNTRSC